MHEAVVVVVLLLLLVMIETAVLLRFLLLSVSVLSVAMFETFGNQKDNVVYRMMRVEEKEDRGVLCIEYMVLFQVLDCLVRIHYRQYMG
ncbi:hypothetical protein J3Q64DRAFT_1753686 [Phycomyces blakesleeanus]|uniref:Uncharacterized protein n=1 Tax=Phycomyces blakesleeanus TaxID=4837 RepID=A0ABR3AU05_PHYBL